MIARLTVDFLLYLCADESDEDEYRLQSHMEMRAAAHHCVKIQCEGPSQEVSQTCCMSHQTARAKLHHTSDKTASVKSKAKKKKLPASEEADHTPCMSIILWQTIQYRGKRKINDDWLQYSYCKTWAHDMKHARKSTVSCRR